MCIYIYIYIYMCIYIYIYIYIWLRARGATRPPTPPDKGMCPEFSTFSGHVFMQPDVLLSKTIKKGAVLLKKVPNISLSLYIYIYTRIHI